MKKIITTIFVIFFLTSCFDRQFDEFMGFAIDDDMETENDGITKDSVVSDNVIYGKFPIASRLRISEKELLTNQFSQDDLKIMRNEIYARHGFIFKKGGDMELYFESQSWYRPRYKNVEGKLTGIEKANVQTILKAVKKISKVQDNIQQLEDEAGGYGTIQVENLRLRSQPTMDAETVALLKKGSFVNVEDYTRFKSTIKLNGKEINDVWYNITTESGKTGWVHGCCVDVTWP